MLTFQNLHETYETITKDNSTANIALGKLLINDTHKSVCGLGDFTFLDDEFYCSSVASQAPYRLPHNYQPNSLISVYVLNGGIKYFPTEKASTTEFDRLSAVANSASYPQYYNAFNNYVNFYPLPSDTSWEIHFKYRQVPREMTADNYITGTITATNNSRTITGSGTTFTSAMEGRKILLPDGLWYEIQTYTSATSISLSKFYEGTTTSGASFIIGDCPIIPDGFQNVCLYEPLELYFMSKGEEKRSGFYKQLKDKAIEEIKSRFLNRTSQQVFNAGRDIIVNPNDYPLGLHQ